MWNFKHVYYSIIYISKYSRIEQRLYKCRSFVPTVFIYNLNYIGIDLSLHLTYWQRFLITVLEHLHHLICLPHHPETSGLMEYKRGIRQPPFPWLGRELLSTACRPITAVDTPNLTGVCAEGFTPALLAHAAVRSLLVYPGVFLLSSLTLIIWRKLIYLQLHSLQFGHKWLIYNPRFVMLSFKASVLLQNIILEES